MDRKLTIAVAGRTRGSNSVEHKEVTWDQLAGRLGRFKVTDETFAEYMAMSRDDQLRIKDVGSFVGGKFSGSTRRKDELVFRSVLCLDLDHLGAEDLAAAELAYGEFAVVIHSTHKHSAQAPRLRLVFPLTRDVTLLEYEPLARVVASWLGLDYFDRTGYQPARVMFWPSRSSDGDEVYERISGRWVCPDEVLGTLEDWSDPFSWPKAAGEDTPRRPDEKVEYAPGKEGIVGAFCRAYDIHEAIAAFDLPYEATGNDDRYTYGGGSSSEGAVVYDFDTQLYSHHESDPASGLHNAWDLVRLHLYGDLDTDEDLAGPPGRWPSYRALARQALQDPAVRDELPSKRALDEIVFDDLTGADAPPVDIDDEGDIIRESFMDRIERRIHNCEMLQHFEETKQIIGGALDHLRKDQVDRLAALIRDQQINTLGRAEAESKAAIRDGFKEIGKTSPDGDITDPDRELAQYVLNAAFDGGDLLKRVAKKFWTFEEGLWAPDDQERIEGEIQRVLTELRESDPEENPGLHNLMGDRPTVHITTDVTRWLQRNLARLEKRDDPLGLLRRYPLPIINCRNGTIWFDEHGKGRFEEHNPDDFFTTRIDTLYDPSAACPLWDEFIESAFSDSLWADEMVRHVEELGGYVIQMSRWLKLWVLCHGPTNTGKSTFQRVLLSLLGSAGNPKGLEGFSDPRFGNYGLLGKLLVTEDDMGRAKTLDDGLVKRISEEKEVQTDVKNADELKFMSRAFFLINSNHWPRTKDITDAFRRRALVIPFTFNFEEHGVADDRKQQRMLAEEMPGILNRFISGLRRLRARGDFDVPQPCEDAKEAWLARANPVSAFKHDLLVRAEDGWVLRSQLWDSYRQWYRVEYPRQDPGSKHDVLERFDQLLGFSVRRGHQGGVGYPGWELIEEQEF